VIGGMPVLFEELFPTMECGPCLLEPFEEQVLHGDYAHNIELLLLSEVTGVTGYYGNFTATIKQAPRLLGPHASVAEYASSPARRRPVMNLIAAWTRRRRFPCLPRGAA